MSTFDRDRTTHNIPEQHAGLDIDMHLPIALELPLHACFAA